MTSAAIPQRPEPFAFPSHNGGHFAPVPCRTAASWPAGHFAENLAVMPDGAVLISLHSHKRVDRYDPTTGQLAAWASFPAPVAGLVLDRAGTLWATGGEVGKPPGYIWRVGADAQVQHWLDIPDAYFMNGATLHPDGRRLLTAESVTGRVLAVNLETPRCMTWLADERLKPENQGTPGANGVKLFGGHVYVSVTDRNLLLRAPVEADGACGPVEACAENLRADDFAFATDGTAYIATHPANSVLRLGADGTRTTLAGPGEGAVGTTAVAFGRGPSDGQALYVTANGGLWSPYQGEVQPAKLLRLEVGAAGQLLLAP